VLFYVLFVCKCVLYLCHRVTTPLQLTYISYHMIKRFVANNLVLSLDKTNIMKFITKNSSHSTLHIGYKEKYIKEQWLQNFLLHKLTTT
jgi:hypothetical protein